MKLHFALDQIMTESIHVGGAVFKQLYRPFLGNTLKYFKLSETYQAIVWFVTRLKGQQPVTKSLALRVVAINTQQDRLGVTSKLHKAAQSCSSVNELKFINTDTGLFTTSHFSAAWTKIELRINETKAIWKLALAQASF